jgi:hypothetical protein
LVECSSLPRDARISTILGICCSAVAALAYGQKIKTKKVCLPFSITDLVAGSTTVLSGNRKKEKFIKIILMFKHNDGRRRMMPPPLPPLAGKKRRRDNGEESYSHRSPSDRPLSYSNDDGGDNNNYHDH